MAQANGSDHDGQASSMSINSDESAQSPDVRVPSWLAYHTSSPTAVNPRSVVQTDQNNNNAQAMAQNTTGACVPSSPSGGPPPGQDPSLQSSQGHIINSPGGSRFLVRAPGSGPAPQPGRTAAPSRGLRRRWNPERSDRYEILPAIRQDQGLSPRTRDFGTGADAGRNQLAYYGGDPDPRTRFDLDFGDADDRPQIQHLPFPRRDAIVPRGLTLQEICQRYPFHAWGKMFRLFIAEGWSAKNVYDAIPSTVSQARKARRDEQLEGDTTGQDKTSSPRTGTPNKVGAKGQQDRAHNSMQQAYGRALDDWGKEAGHLAKKPNRKRIGGSVRGRSRKRDRSTDDEDTGNRPIPVGPRLIVPGDSILPGPPMISTGQTGRRRYSDEAISPIRIPMASTQPTTSQPLGMPTLVPDTSVTRSALPPTSSAMPNLPMMGTSAVQDSVGRELVRLRQEVRAVEDQVLLLRMELFRPRHLSFAMTRPAAFERAVRMNFMNYQRNWVRNAWSRNFHVSVNQVPDNVGMIDLWRRWYRTRVRPLPDASAMTQGQVDLWSRQEMVEILRSSLDTYRRWRGDLQRQLHTITSTNQSARDPSQAVAVGHILDQSASESVDHAGRTSPGRARCQSISANDPQVMASDIMSGRDGNGVTAPPTNIPLQASIRFPNFAAAGSVAPDERLDWRNIVLFHPNDIDRPEIAALFMGPRVDTSVPFQPTLSVGEAAGQLRSEFVPQTRGETFERWWANAMTAGSLQRALNIENRRARLESLLGFSAQSLADASDERIDALWNDLSRQNLGSG